MLGRTLHYLPAGIVQRTMEITYGIERTGEPEGFFHPKPDRMPSMRNQISCFANTMSLCFAEALATKLDRIVNKAVRRIVSRSRTMAFFANDQ